MNSQDQVSEDNFNNTLAPAEDPDSVPIPKLSDVLLWKISMPVIIFGVVMNLISLRIWSSIICSFQNTVLLFKALCLSDTMFLVFFFPAKLWIFYNDFMQLVFNVLSRGNRTVGIYITLLLVIVRYVKLFYPFHTHRLMSRFRLTIALYVTIICTFSLQTFIDGSDMFMPKILCKWVKFGLRRGPMISIPAVAQNVLMGLVLWKLWKSSRKLHFLRKSSMLCEDADLQNGCSDATPSTREIRLSVAKKTPDKQKHEKQTPADKPLNPQTPTGAGSTTGSQLQLQPVQESVESHLGPQSETQLTAGEGTHTETSSIQSNVDPAEFADLAPRTGEPENTSNANKNIENNTKENTSNANKNNEKYKESRRVSFTPENEPHYRSSGITSMTLADCSDRVLALVLLAICLSSFIAFPVASAVRGYQLATNTQENTVINNTRIIIHLLNSCVNPFFYMFVKIFRKRLAEKLVGSVGTFVDLSRNKPSRRRVSK